MGPEDFVGRVEAVGVQLEQPGEAVAQPGSDGHQASGGMGVSSWAAGVKQSAQWRVGLGCCGSQSWARWGEAVSGRRGGSWMSGKPVAGHHGTWASGATGVLGEAGPGAAKELGGGRAGSGRRGKGRHGEVVDLPRHPGNILFWSLWFLQFPAKFPHFFSPVNFE